MNRTSPVRGYRLFSTLGLGLKWPRKYCVFMSFLFRAFFFSKIANWSYFFQIGSVWVSNRWVYQLCSGFVVGLWGGRNYTKVLLIVKISSILPVSIIFLVKRRLILTAYIIHYKSINIMVYFVFANSFQNQFPPNLVCNSLGFYGFFGLKKKIPLKIAFFQY